MGPIGQWRHARKMRLVLKSALDGESERVGAEQSAVVEGFIAAGEWRLAYQQLLDALTDLEIAPLEKTTVHLREADRLIIG